MRGGSRSWLRGRRGSGCATARSTLVQRRTRDRVAVEGSVDVEQNTLVVRLVKFRAGDALRLIGAGAGDLEVQALRVVLGAVGLVSAVQGDDFVAEHVFSRRDGLWDRHGPAVVVRDQVV